MSTKLSLPSVFAVQRGAVVTDGLFYSVLADGREVEVPVVRHGIRGVMTAKNDVSNVQRTESAKTHPNAEGLLVKFSFRPIPASELIFSCSDTVYREAIDEFIDTWLKTGVPEFDEVCRRYARNILHGRWLWRNTILGDVRVEASVGETVYVNDKRLEPNNFENYSNEECALAEHMGQLICGQGGVAIDIKGHVAFGFTGAVEVFPSQNMVTNKPKGFARSLYKVNMLSRKTILDILATSRKDGEDANEFMADMIVMGHAALRDQKIGNAIRTIDTWYGDGEAIAIEPGGESLKYNTSFRKSGNTAKSLLEKINIIKPGSTFNSNAAYLIALLQRGGVFSQKS